MIQRFDQSQDAAHLWAGKHDRKFELGIGPDQLQFVRPDTVKGLFPKEFDGADGLGTGLARHLLVSFEVNAILSDIFGREQIRGFGVKLADLADAGVVGLLGAWANGQKTQVVCEGF